MGLTAKKVYAILNGKIQKVNEEIASLGTAIFWGGSVETEEDLPVSPQIGAMYNIASDSTYGQAGMNVVYTGSGWDAVGPTIDLSALRIPNPYKLILKGAVNGEYDGSKEVTVTIPSGGGAGEMANPKIDDDGVLYWQEGV